jgi:hypothetical protein
MKVTYTNSVEDWAAAQFHHMETWPGFRQAVWFWRWTFALGLGIVGVMVTADWAVWARGALGLLLAATVAALYPKYVKNRYRTRAFEQLNLKDGRPFLTCERSIELTDDGIRIESLVGNQLIKWGFIKAIDDVSGYLHVRFQYGLGFPIPKTSLTSDQKDSLVKGIRARIASPASSH